jgi:hypothetical protein
MADAEHDFKRAIALFEKGGFQDHPNIAFYLRALAQLYQQQQRFTEVFGRPVAWHHRQAAE